ncbi:MAG: cell division protein FtsA [Thermodesulfovibrionia bacterium]|nr:cell division protein FtsA [Thermodesulfovibrionia bacterium]
MKKGRLIVSLDIGTVKTSVIVGEIGEAGLHIIGRGSSHSKGLRKGAIINIEDAVESVKEAVREAEAVTGIEINAVYLGIGGEHISSLSSHGVIALSKEEIGQRDVDSVIDAARAVAIPFDREVLQVIPVGFSINGQNGITDPRGMGGVRLEADVRIITGSATFVQNFVKTCEKAGLEVTDIVLKPFATAEAVITDDERSLGTAVIDIGGGTTEIAIFHEGLLCHTSVVPVGGNNFTNDIAIGLRTPAPEAEKIKKEFGCTMISMVSDDEEIEIAYSGDRQAKSVPRHLLIEIIQPRAVELFKLIKDEIRASGFDGLLSSGAVLTGGSAMMEGMDVMAENILDMPVRIGTPAGIEGITDDISSPMYATGVGLLLYGAREMRAENEKHSRWGISRVINWARETLHL